jgi:hypothetical protein
MLFLLRLVAGEEQAMALAQRSTGETAESLREAAGFYIQQVMFASGSVSYRIIGVDADVSDERLREHYRWLARWLHPDRNRDQWEAVYADRVNRAWQDVRTVERRQHYDQSRREYAESPADLGRAPPVIVRHVTYSEAAAPSWNLRWLPAAILYGLGVGAVLTVSLFYVLRWSKPPSRVREPAALAAAAPMPMVAPVSAVKEQGSLAKLAGPANPDNVQAPLAVAELPTPMASTRSNKAPGTLLQTMVPDAPASPPKREGGSLAEARPEASALARLPAISQPAPPKAERPSRVRAAIGEVGARAVAVQIPPAIPVFRTELQKALDASPAPIDERDANRVLGNFSQAYAEGDLEAMRAMFTSDARGAQGGLDAILADYGRLFGSSQERTLAVRDVSWFASGPTLTVIATYQTTIKTGRKNRPYRTRGDLRLDMRRENDHWRIYRLKHDARPG